jgi:hypothetical protein
MEKTSIAFLHASPAAIAPTVEFYGRYAPEFEILTFLEDGLMGLFRAGEVALVQHRLAAMLEAAQTIYQVRAAVIACSAVTSGSMSELRVSSAIPVLKIDEPMAEHALAVGSRLALVATFAPTIENGTCLLEDTAQRLGRSVSIHPCFVPKAYEYLLQGDTAHHDELVIAAIHQIATSPLDAIVLAQVSMVGVVPRLSVRQPIFNSLGSSLTRLRQLIAD